MENTLEILASSISRRRKELNMTQDELASKLGVTFQAVSKWETAKAAPDITFLPMMADIFSCSIDELFSRTPEAPGAPTNKGESTLPWDDDGAIRGAIFEGRRLLDTCDDVQHFTFEISGEAKNVYSFCTLTVNGDVYGDCTAGGNVTVGSDIDGDCTVGGYLSVGGDIDGDCTAGGNITVEGDIGGDCDAGGNISIEGDLDGSCSAKGSVTVEGDANCDSISANGNVSICGDVNGNITAKGKISIEGDVGD